MNVSPFGNRTYSINFGFIVTCKDIVSKPTSFGRVLHGNFLTICSSSYAVIVRLQRSPDQYFGLT